MEIRDPVHGSIYFSDAEVKILDTAIYQRLRAIKQLGFSEFSFPGATHNRYLHSIGVCHLAGIIFDQIFKAYPFSKPSSRQRLRQATRLAALLHDVGHGPLSHTTEQVMPSVKSLRIQLYDQQNVPQDRKANHEDYTLKYVTDSEIASLLESEFGDLKPLHIASLIDPGLICDDDFFSDGKVDFRPVLSQIVSSELDADRLDYLERDSFFCGINYGRIDRDWIVQNLTLHVVDSRAHLALNRRALYAFDDFLISRHHMHLMVYFHHKSIIYEEMLNRYLTSPDCDFVLPANIHEYTRYTDYKLHEHLAQKNNPWAQRISHRRPFRVLLEMHNTADSSRPEAIRGTLLKNGIDVIWASSKARLSKYHSALPEGTTSSIFVVDQYDRWVAPMPIDQATEIFKKYEGARIIDRLYVAPEHYADANRVLNEMKF